MKRKEIILLLAGCLLVLAPLHTRAAFLPDLLPIGTINSEIPGTTEDLELPAAGDGQEENVEAGDTEGKEEAQDPGDTAGTADGMDGKTAEKSEQVTDKAEESGQDRELAAVSGQTDTVEDTEKRGSALQDILGESIGSGVILEASKTEVEYVRAYEKAKNRQRG